jgi:hypothetical protein
LAIPEQQAIIGQAREGPRFTFGKAQHEAGEQRQAGEGHEVDQQWEQQQSVKGMTLKESTHFPPGAAEKNDLNQPSKG